MSASMVRMGGIGLFVLLVLAIIASFLGGTAAVRIVLNVIETLLLLFALWATKGYLNARGYARADLAILVIIAGTVILFILSLISGSALQGMMVNRTGGATAIGAVAIIMLVIMLVLLIFGLLLSLRFIDFGKIGGGIWKATGILYLIVQICFIIMVVLFLVAALAKSFGLMGAGGILGLVGGLVAIAALIVHGIALVTGAGKMGAPAAPPAG